MPSNTQQPSKFGSPHLRENLRKTFEKNKELFIYRTESIDSGPGAGTSRAEEQPSDAILISVIMPNFNREAYVDLAIKSVFDQSLHELELVVVDDGSTDSSVQIVEKLAGSDSRLRLIRHNRNMGTSAALNTGILNAAGDSLTFIDSDDIFATDRLQRLNYYLPRGCPPSVIYSDPIYIGEDAKTVSSTQSTASRRPSGNILKYLLTGRYRFTGRPIAAPKSCFESVGPYDESLTWGEDFEMSLRLAERYPFVFDPVSTYGYRFHPQMMTRKIRRKDRWSQQGRILEKHLMTNQNHLDGQTIDVSFVYLFSCFVAGQCWDKILWYGFTKQAGFKAMASMPTRAWNDKRKRVES